MRYQVSILSAHCTQAYKSQNYINILPTWALETSYASSSLTVTDYHGKQATCTATVAIWVRCTPDSSFQQFSASSVIRMSVSSGFPCFQLGPLMLIPSVMHSFGPSSPQ